MERRSKGFTVKHHKSEPAVKKANQRFVWFVVKFFLFFFISFSLYAQEEAQVISEETEQEESGETEEEITETPMTPERRRAEMEIRTSTLGELAAWCKSLGLSESGTRDDLSKRLREHFDLPLPDADRSRKIITIESAQTTEYFTITAVDEEYARLSGDVVISLKDGDITHKISANEILFNRSRNILTARGRVIYEKIEEDKTETFRGENITVNIDDWSSIFLDGITQYELGSGSTAYVFSGTVITRNSEEVTILSNATISSTTSEESLWSIKASRVWLLPGSDFAIANAVLRVGEIPVLWLPFFYYPADELVFRPVIGYRSREGGFLQTTIYILGRPKVNEEDSNSFTNILGAASDSETELQGIFLRSTGRRVVNKEEVNLRTLIDYYVNLGFYAGLELIAPKTGILNPTEFSFGLGFSRTITPVNNTHTPYFPDYDGSSDWNQSNFISMTVPFRYRMRFNSSISSGSFNLSWDLPYYSDPYIDNDFTQDRSESMDFFNMIQQGGIFDDANKAQTVIGTYEWNLSGNYNPSVRALNPFITRLSINSLYTSLTFRTIRDTTISSSYDPARLFFAPNKLTIYNISTTIAGTPLTVGGTQSRTARTKEPEKEDPLNGIGVPVSPWANEEENEAQTESSNTSRIINPPVINQSFNLARAGNARFTMDYSLTPTSSSELQFMSRYWNSYEQVDWSEIQSINTNLGADTNLNFRIDHTNGIFNNTLTFTGSTTWKDLTYQNEEAYTDQTAMQNDRRQMYSQTRYVTTYGYNGTIRPFHSNPIFGSTNLQYNLRGTLLRSKRFTTGDGPELTPQWGSWIKENVTNDEFGLTNHQLSANFAANVMEKAQSISVSATLPPLDAVISTNATFRIWITETNVNFRLERPETSEDWIFKPINITETLRFGTVGTFSYFMVLDPEVDYEITTIRSTLTLGKFNVTFLANKTQELIFDDNLRRWVQQPGDPSLFPRRLDLKYESTFPAIHLLGNRLNLRLNFTTALNFDLLQHTNSNFEFNFGFDFAITEILKLTISAKTVNSVIWRYFYNVPGFEELTRMYDPGPQNNIFTDLLDSFNFFDEAARRRSGFKMHSLNMAAEHKLGDWTATLKVTVYPDLLNTIPQRYEVVADVTFSVQWHPISEIKSNINYAGRTDQWAVE